MRLGMTKSQQKVLRSTGLIGILLTFLVVILDRVYVLQPIEHVLDDKRALYCQHYVPPPTNAIVHFDIDDAALSSSSLGRWPWPRTMLADMVRELSRAGAKVVAFDVMFPEPEGRGPLGAYDDNLEPSKADLDFADALRGCNRALLPVSFLFKGHSSEDHVHEVVRDILARNLELERKDLPAALKACGAIDVPPDVAEAHFVRAREEAMLGRLLSKALAGKSIQEAREILLPNSGVSTQSPTLRLLRAQYDLAQAITLLLAKSRPEPEPAGLPSLLEGTDALQTPIPVLAGACRYSAFVNYLPLDDGIVRTVPLWVRYRDRLIPQIGLALACADLEVDVNDPRQVEVTADRVIIRPPHELPIFIPVTTLPASSPNAVYGSVGLQIYIPWAGKSWKSVYGTDTEGNPLRHYSLNMVWDVWEGRQALARNNHSADEALDTLLNATDPDLPDEYSKLRDRLDPSDFTTREEWINKTLKKADDTFMSKGSSQKLDERGLDAYHALQDIQKNTPALQKVLAKNETDLQYAVKNKAVLIGSIASGAQDQVSTSIDPATPGPVVHSIIFNAIMTRRFLWNSPPWMTLVIAITLGLLTTAAVTAMSPWTALASTAALAATYLAFNGVWAYDKHRMIFGLATPLAAIAVPWAGSTLLRYILERTEKAHITRRFRTYVDPALVNYVIENPQKARLDGERKEITVVFTDLQGFTSLTEKLGEQAVHVLSEYMGTMVPVIRASNGYVNKFIGDGIMCLFNAFEPNPRHAADALNAVMNMNRAMVPFNLRLKERGLPTLIMRAGINTDHVIVGDAGAESCDYTALGDGVNLASRLESANKAVGTHTLLGARTAQMIDGNYLLRPIGRLHVVGKTEPVMTFEPMALTADATEDQKRLVEETAKIVELFHKGEFGLCVEAIDAAEKRMGDSPKLLRLYRELCERFQIEVPIDFRGQIVLEAK